MMQSILSVEDFQADATRLLDQARSLAAPLVLTQDGRASAVVEDYEQYQARERALCLLKLLLQGEQDVAEGRLTDHADLFAALRKRLADADA